MTLIVEVQLTLVCTHEPCLPVRKLPPRLCLQLVDEERSALLMETEKLLLLCQQLQTGAKTPVQGKTATFQKVPRLHLFVFTLFI